MLELQTQRAFTIDAVLAQTEEELALGKVPASMDALCDANIWICDSGASNHSTNSDAGARNKRDTTSASLGHVGQAVKATSSIDVPGYFLGKDGKPGLRTRLDDMSYNNRLNFNLMSLTRMLINGWKVTKGIRLAFRSRKAIMSSISIS